MGNDTRLCTIEGCEHKYHSRGWCNMHYRRWLKHGDPLQTLTPTRVDGSADERFWAKVSTQGECWEWTAGKSVDGYGTFHYVDRDHRAHRWAWEYMVGSITEGLELDHLCRNRACVRPEHLDPVPHVENMQRTPRPTHCPQGHRYAGRNVVMENNARRCRTCRNAQERQRYQRRKDETSDAK
jgi:hypothetical protein